METQRKRGFFDFDYKLAAIANNVGGTFKRFKTMSEMPFAWEAIQSTVTDEQVKSFEDKLTRELSSKFVVPKVVNSDFGELINLDAALDGVPECYRVKQQAKGVLKIGLNVSGQYDVPEAIFAIRCAAVLCAFKLAKARGQAVQIDLCYGFYGLYQRTENESHFRCCVPYPTVEIIKSIMTESFRRQMAQNVVCPVSNGGAGYRLWKLTADQPEMSGEFDFVLDRLETSDRHTEYQRVLEQLKAIA